MELHDVRISIPLGSSAVPEIAAIDGSHRHLSQEGTLLWTMDLLDQSNRTGTLEFNIASRDPEAFFPITVTFASTQLFCNVQVGHATPAFVFSVKFGRRRVPLRLVFETDVPSNPSNLILLRVHDPFRI